MPFAAQNLNLIISQNTVRKIAVKLPNQKKKLAPLAVKNFSVMTGQLFIVRLIVRSQNAENVKENPAQTKFLLAKIAAKNITAPKVL